MASGETLAIFSALHNEPPSASAATLDTRNLHPVLDHDGAGTNESSVFASVMPRHYDGGGTTVYYHFAMSTATSACVDLDGAWERIGACILDIDADSFAAACSLDDVDVPATAGMIKTASVSFSDGADMDSVAVGEGFRFKFTRDSITDGATGDLELRFIEITET